MTLSAEISLFCQTPQTFFIFELLNPCLERLRTYPLSEMATAHTYSETEHAVGKVVIAVTS
jgi:hypothetical protein